MNASILRSTFILGLTAFVATFALSHINAITYPIIQKQERQKQENALALVLPGYSIGEERSAGGDGYNFTYWIGEKTEGNRTIRAYAFIAEKPGYSGAIRTIVGVDEKSTVLGISIIRQSETPGLGDRVLEAASSATFFQAITGRAHEGGEAPSPWFQEQFKGLNAATKIEIVKKGDWNEAMRDELLRKNSVSAITGATITTRVVKDSIEEGVRTLKMALDEHAKAQEAPVR
ncbi:MAG TPA: FMN-binding protein [Spirochaetota bacterium]|nr:FMN-binding protein [Spirochaetota bacterium]